MDGAHINKTRKFPSYSLTQLEASLAQYEAGIHPLQAYTEASKIAAIAEEIANRKVGISIHFVVPQIA